MKSIEDLRSEIRAQALVLVGYSIAKDDAFLSDTAQILMEIAAPSDDDAGELAEAYQNMRQYFSDAQDGADSTETTDQPTQEPQEEDSGADAVVEAVNFARNEHELVTNTNGAEPETNSGGVIDATGDTDVLNGIGTSMSVGLVDEGADADPDSPVIGSFSEVSDKAVRAEGGDPVSRVDALNTAAQIVPDFGPIES